MIGRFSQAAHSRINADIVAQVPALYRSERWSRLANIFSRGSCHDSDTASLLHVQALSITTVPSLAPIRSQLRRQGIMTPCAQPLDPAEKTFSEEPDAIKTSPPLSPSLAGANYYPDGGIYDNLEDDWLLSSDVGELSLFDFLDSLAVVPITLDKLNQRFREQSRDVHPRVSI